MQNEEQWRPSKYGYADGKLFASRDPEALAPTSRLMVTRVSGAFNTHLAEHCRGDLLDLGCGKAPFYAAYRPLVDSVFCVDWENTNHGTSHIDQCADLNEPLPIEDNRFDTILLSDVLEHIAEPWALWREMHRVLKPSGKIIISVPFMYWLHETPYDYYRYTEHALTKMATDCGMDVLVLESYGGAPVVLTDIFCKSVPKIPVAKMLMTSLATNTTSLLLKTPFGKRLNDRSSKRIPSGYFMVAQKQ